LVQKLGFKEGFRVGFVNRPRQFEKELDPLPNDVEIIIGRLPKGLDLIILFADSQQALKRDFPKLAQKLAQNGMLWIAWPKKASGVATDLSDNSVRQIGLDAGLVDVKVCAINDIWAGLKFVYRLKDRKSRLKAVNKTTRRST
jgi:expansin (peptidoglycan-binding protein)